MDDQHHTIDPATTDGWARGDAPPTAKERTAVQQAVSRLLDALAPERTVSRITRPPAAVERHRTPRGCILQAAAGAVSVSWFPDAANDAAFGELQVVAWRGVVSRPGSAHRTEGAVVVRKLVLRPVERAPEAVAWRADDDTIYETDALAAYCLALLDEQMSGDTHAEELTG